MDTERGASPHPVALEPLQPGIRCVGYAAIWLASVSLCVQVLDWFLMGGGAFGHHCAAYQSSVSVVCGTSGECFVRNQLPAPTLTGVVGGSSAESPHALVLGGCGRWIRPTRAHRAIDIIAHSLNGSDSSCTPSFDRPLCHADAIVRCGTFGA